MDKDENRLALKSIYVPQFATCSVHSYKLSFIYVCDIYVIDIYSFSGNNSQKPCERLLIAEVVVSRDLKWAHLER